MNISKITGRITMVLLLSIMVVIPFWGCIIEEKATEVLSGSSTPTTVPPTAGPPPGSALIKVMAIDTQDATQWNAITTTGSFPYKSYWSTANTTVPTNRVVVLQGSATPPTGAAVRSYSWSGVTFTYLGGDTTKPYFTPATVGQTPVRLTVAFTDGTNATANLTITAANYVGKANCSGCHLTIYNSWLRTNATDFMNHADAFTLKTSGKRGPLSSGSCFQCHTAGYDFGMLGGTDNSASNGFDDATRHGGAQTTAGTAWYSAPLAGLAGTYENPIGSGIWYTNPSLLNQPPAQADLNGIQCEQCHGPASMHFGDPSGISKSYSESNCTTPCHADRRGAWTYKQSSHYNSTNSNQYLSAACNKCHTAQGFVNVIEKGNAAVNYTQADPVTCAACHNVHEATSDNMLRFEGEAEVSGTTVNAELSAVCVKCHTNENATVGSNPEHNQAEMFYGTTITNTTGSGGKGYNYSGKTYANMEHATEIEEACIQCHMANTLMPTSYSDAGAPRTVMAQNITSATTSFYIGANTNFPTSGTLRIGNEQITYSALSSSAPYTVVVTQRGANGTTAASHSIGDYITYGDGAIYRVGGHSWNLSDDVKGNDSYSVTSPTAWFTLRQDNYYDVNGCNECHRQFNAPETTFNGAGLRTNLTGGLTITATSIAVNSTTGFPSSGGIQVGSEQIAYTSTTASSFTGLTRGANVTGPARSASTANASSKIAVVVADTITVTDTSAFPNSGVLYIEYKTKSGSRNMGSIKEKIAYIGKTATAFNGCYRAMPGFTSMIAHPTGTTITLLAGVQPLVINPSLGVADNTTTLSTTMTSSTLGDITIGNDTGWPLTGGEVKIESEWMGFTHTASGDNIITITQRGLYGTAAAAHTASTSTPMVYFPALTGSAATLYVPDTTDFPSTGIVKVDGEFVKYSGKTATTLTGLTRGAGGTMAVPHLNYYTVEKQLFSPFYEATPVTAQVPNFQKIVVTMLSALEGILPKSSNGAVMITGTSMTTAQKNAAFNYYFVKNDKSFGVHNYTYAMQLLYDSITDIGGTPPYSRP